jgi:CubicO group peptidase (beta-lactamase class C family)
MVTNQLAASQPANPGWLGLNGVSRGFGLGVSVVLETDKADFMRRGSVGTVSWPGAYGGWWQADPKDGSVLIFLAHNMVDLALMAKGIGLGVWGAIDTFQTLAPAAKSTRAFQPC